VQTRTTTDPATDPAAETATDSAVHAPARASVSPATGPVAEGGRRPGRLDSLDAVRGATIAGMLLVNNPGTWSAIYPPLRHAAWHGWTPTDLIFPFFLFIMGVASVFSLSKRRSRGVGRGRLARKIVHRSLVLVALGLVLHGFPDYDLSTIRIPGVLQRIGVAYLVATPFVAFTGWRVQAGVAGALLLGYWALVTLVPVPGVGPGVLEPGQDLGAWIDRTVFGTEHLWSQSRTWDPEGLLSTIPAVASVLLGALAGHWLRAARGGAAGRAMVSTAAHGDAAPLRTVAGLASAAVVAIALGLLWGSVFPINKPLWTSSYALFTAGAAALLLALAYWVIDIRGRRAWSVPFLVFGTNAIAAFFLSSLSARLLNIIRVPTAGDPVPLKTFLYGSYFEPWLAPRNASLAFAIAFVLFWLGATAILYRKRIFIRV
jgi:predicted acyltransferase